MNDYNIELIFRVWIKDEKKHIVMRNDLREQVFKTLTQNDIDMPYETCKCHYGNTIVFVLFCLKLLVSGIYTFREYKEVL